MTNLSKIAGWLSKDDHPIIPFVYIAIPFLLLDVGSIHMAQKMTFMVGVLIILALQFQNVWLRWFVLYMAAFFVFTLFSLVLDNALLGSYERKLLFSRLVWLTTGIIFYLAIVNSKTSLQWFYSTICIVTIIQCIIVLMQMAGFTPFLDLLRYIGVNVVSRLETNAGFGTLGNNNFVAAMIAITTPFFIRKYWKWIIPLLIFTLVLLKTSTAVIALTVGMLLYFDFNKLGFFIVLCGIIYIFFIDNNMFKIFKSKRISFWITIIQELIHNKTALIYGFGPAKLLPAKIICPLHNEWLEIIYYYGLTGVALVIGYVTSIYRSNKILFVAFVIACVNALGNYPMHLAPSAALILIIMGLIQRESINHG